MRKLANRQVERVYPASWFIACTRPAPQRHNNVFSLEIRGFYRLIKLFSSVISLGFAGKTIDKLHLFVYIFITHIQQLSTFRLFLITTFLPPNDSVVITYPPPPPFPRHTPPFTSRNRFALPCVAAHSPSPHPATPSTLYSRAA